MTHDTFRMDRTKYFNWLVFGLHGMGIGNVLGNWNGGICRRDYRMSWSLIIKYPLNLIFGNEKIEV